MLIAHWNLKLRISYRTKTQTAYLIFAFHADALGQQSDDIVRAAILSSLQQLDSFIQSIQKQYVLHIDETAKFHMAAFLTAAKQVDKTKSRRFSVAGDYGEFGGRNENIKPT
jgi:hypothetical protein